MFPLLPFPPLLASTHSQILPGLAFRSLCEVVVVVVWGFFPPFVLHPCVKLMVAPDPFGEGGLCRFYVISTILGTVAFSYGSVPLYKMVSTPGLSVSHLREQPPPPFCLSFRYSTLSATARGFD